MATETPGKVLSLEEILAQEDVEYTTVPAYKDGEFYRIRSITAEDMLEWTETKNEEEKKIAGLRLLVRSLVDSNGNRIADDQHIPAFKRKSYKQTQRIVTAILAHNEMTPAKDAEVKKD